MSPQIIGHDKLNQLRHVKFLHDGNGLAKHIWPKNAAAILRPKFELVDRKLSEGLKLISAAAPGAFKPRGETCLVQRPRRMRRSGSWSCVKGRRRHHDRRRCHLAPIQA